jgi:hypothetical protein
MEGEKIALIHSMLPELEQETKTMRRVPCNHPIGHLEFTKV